ncbi:MAG TPA: redox-regulated ATPase YchF [Methanothermobacter sp.]|nr:redox-regulated ATPase YchF [Methanothermobacter tenebrarum]MDD3454949.1 redox-regulated ATPase YchF [Methanobacteriales archaeon]MDX9692732.1 redox-regulated ATPase YchF [Methanothermobacter sp.]HHW15916.1 redox-regulated ATPase YchF [Methanothermobacter sp.]HOQ20408.1 redox-regulated ATPase YchF [Methanothermobacter sp.]
MIEIGITGKPNVGKSSFFNAATLSKADVASYPFTTIDSNRGIAYVTSQCPCREFKMKCNPKNSICEDGVRFIPVELIDVAGLVPGAHKGRGLGNKFLDDLRQARVFLHVVDASGSTDEEGRPVEPGSYDPINDVEFLEKEILMWLYGIIGRNWDRLLRKAASEKIDMAKIIHEQFSGIGVSVEDIIEASRKLEKDYQSWDNEDLLLFIDELLKVAKPGLIVANKADLPTAKENIKRLKERYPNVVPASAEAELALKRAANAGLIDYKPGDDDFKVLDEGELTKKQLNALEYIRENVLKVYGNTGVQEALNRAVFDLLDMIVVYPVEDEHKLSDKQGNILPDAFLIPRGSKPRDLAYLIHTEIGDSFMHAVDARKKMRVASDYKLQHGDIITIICR